MKVPNSTLASHHQDLGISSFLVQYSTFQSLLQEKVTYLALELIKNNKNLYLGVSTYHWGQESCLNQLS